MAKNWTQTRDITLRLKRNQGFVFSSHTTVLDHADDRFGRDIKNLTHQRMQLNLKRDRRLVPIIKSLVPVFSMEHSGCGRDAINHIGILVQALAFGRRFHPLSPWLALGWVVATGLTVSRAFDPRISQNSLFPVMVLVPSVWNSFSLPTFAIPPSHSVST